MTKEVRVAEFKSRLSEHLRMVRRGHEIIVKDRDTPIARVIRYEQEKPFITIKPTKSWKEVAKLLAKLKPIPGLKPSDVEQAIRETKADWYDKNFR